MYAIIFRCIIFLLYTTYCYLQYSSVCNHNKYSNGLLWTGLFILLFLINRFIKKDFKEIGEKIARIAIFMFITTIVINLWIYKYDGISIIRKAEIIEVKRYSKGGDVAVVKFRDYDSVRTVKVFHMPKHYTNGSYIFISKPLECSDISDIHIKRYKNELNYPQIYDFAFLKDTTFCTYHDYSLINPDLVYYHVGFNVGYKAVRDSMVAKDFTTILNFIDVCGKHRRIKYDVKNYTSVPDTLLVFRNINENIDDRFIVCAPEVNTPENWAKISDYGYIFHYDVYSKEEIESQCPQIRNYVEKYKERTNTK